MSARDELRAHLNGKPAEQTPEDLAAFLTDQLGLAEVGRRVVGADVFGRGSKALADIQLSDGARLAFERFADVAKPAALTAELVTQTGVYRAFKGAEAGAVAAAVHALAKHHAEGDADEAVREFGSEFLRLAPTIDVSMDDQADRWRAFSELARMSPARDAGEDRSAAALAAATSVLVDRASGQRYVRAGWLQAYVKREVGGLYSPAALATQMERVGWTRPGSQGRVKATSPTEARSLVWTFYVVESDWEDAAVNAGESSYARVRAHTRGPVGTPAFTRSPPAEGEPGADGRDPDARLDDRTVSERSLTGQAAAVERRDA